MKKYINAKRLLDNVYCLTSGNACMFLLLGKQYALLLDTGYGFVDFTGELKKITTLPLYVVNSHGHVDHIAGNVFLHQPVFLHQSDAEVCKLHSSPAYRKAAFQEMRKLQRILFFLRLIPKKIDEEAYCNTVFTDYRLLTDNYEFDLGGIHARVIGLPGHTPGSIGLFCPEKRLLFVGDAMNESVWLFLPESQGLSVYIRSLKKALALEFDYFLTGHSSRLIPKAEMRNYLETAENLDYQNGIKQKENGFAPNVEIRSCCKKGVTRRLRQPKILISADKL